MSGFSSVTSNSPADVENSGWEFIVDAKIINNKIVKLESKINLSINRNRLLSYPNLAQSPFASSLDIGKLLNIVKLLHFTGIDPQTGDYTFEDKNHDGQINTFANKANDLYDFDMTPKFDGGFTTNLTLKNWDLSIFFYFRKQMGYSINTASTVPGMVGNQPVIVLNRWQTPGDITNIAKFSTQSTTNSNNYFNFSDSRLTDASFIRLQNVSLSYNLPTRICEKFGLENLKVYGRGENLFLITNYKGLDPEVQSFGSFPIPRVITAGISINF